MDVGIDTDGGTDIDRSYRYFPPHPNQETDRSQAKVSKHPRARHCSQHPGKACDYLHGKCRSFILLTVWRQRAPVETV